MELAKSVLGLGGPEGYSSKRVKGISLLHSPKSSKFMLLSVKCKHMFVMKKCPKYLYFAFVSKINFISTDDVHSHSRNLWNRIYGAIYMSCLY